MLIIGLTGGIATGKSTTAQMIQAKGIPIHDADTCVHNLLLGDGAAVREVAGAFGREILMSDGAVDRQKLGSVVFAAPEKRRLLEDILHPLVAADRDVFLAQNRTAGTPMVVLDVPLLYETGGDALCDFVIVCLTDRKTQWARGLARPGMTMEKWEAIVSSQMPLAEKKARADAIIDTHNGLAAAAESLDAILASIQRKFAQKKKVK